MFQDPPFRRFLREASSEPWLNFRAPAGLTPGEVVGSYTLVCCLGSHDEESVWLAERSGPDHNAVALRIVDGDLDEPRLLEIADLGDESPALSA